MIGVVGLIIAVAAIIVPTLLYVLQGRLARRKATLDWIVAVETSEWFAEASKAFSEARREGRLLEASVPTNEIQRELRGKVLKILNHYELTALHIRQGVLDGRAYRLWMASAFVRDWNAARTFIWHERWRGNSADRKYYGAFYCHFEYLACKWSADAVPISEACGPPESAISSLPS